MHDHRWRRRVPPGRGNYYSVLQVLAVAAALVSLTNCATTSSHQFASPSSDWQTRTGQLLYRTPQTTIIGDVVVRLSKSGDLELTFSKGPGFTLLTLRQDDAFAEMRGPIARSGWSGPVDQAPQQMRSWLGLRDALARGRNQSVVRHSAGSDTFVFRF